MFIVISPQNPDPLYKQVTDQLKDAIDGGILGPEERLPSIREMARGLNISEITIKRAYTDLETGGFIYTRPGMGSFVAPVDRQILRNQKLVEIKAELEALAARARRHGISLGEILALMDELKGSE